MRSRRAADAFWGGIVDIRVRKRPNTMGEGEKIMATESNQTGRASHLLLALTIAVCFVSLAQKAAAQQYQVTYLDSIGGNRSRGNSINNREWIAGFSFVTTNARRHATLWRDGVPKDLGTLGAPARKSNVARPVKNNRGVSPGISQTDCPEPTGGG